MLRVHRIALLCFVLAVVGISISAESESIDEILHANGLPLRLFPKGVKEFDVDRETGRFSVNLNQSCDAKYESELHYEANISGTIGYAQIRNLSGISAQELFCGFQLKGFESMCRALVSFSSRSVLFESNTLCLCLKHREIALPFVAMVKTR